MLLKFSVIVSVSFLMVTGQALLSVYARSIEFPLRFPGVIVDSLRSITFYCLVISYSAGLAGYAYLLRYYPLAEINITLMVTMIALTLAYSHWLGQAITTTQWLGAALATAGLIALQSR
jgi:drug/metabolite transporter (DMT)-like permease